jgi:hypothetical protein
MGKLEDTQLIYIKGLMADLDLDEDKIEEVKDKFQTFLSFIDQDEEYKAIGILILAQWGITQQQQQQSS